MNLDIRTIILLGAVLLFLQIIPLILLSALANRYKRIAVLPHKSTLEGTAKTTIRSLELWR
jgi:hypothetical protein